MRTHPPEQRPPLVRSTLDVAIWLIVKAAAERVALDPRRLNLLLYLSQASYAAAHEGAALIPAVFIATEEGPSEPTITLTLQAGLNAPPEPVITDAATLVLDEIWRRYGAMPLTALQRLVAADGAWKLVLDRNKGGEISRDLMRQAYTKPKPMRRSTEAGPTPSKPAVGQKRSQPASTGVEREPLPRFMLDGRAVSRWQPKRRVSPGEGKI